MQLSYKDNTYMSIYDEFGKVRNEMIFVVAKCVSDNTRVLTPKGMIKIGDIKENEEFKIMSYNFEKDVLQVDSAIKVNSGIKQTYILETENGKTIECSQDHIFFVEDNEKIIEKRLKDLKSGDRILVANPHKNLVVCQQCGKIIPRRTSNFKRDSVFCSIKCSNKNRTFTNIIPESINLIKNDYENGFNYKELSKKYGKRPNVIRDWLLSTKTKIRTKSEQIKLSGINRRCFLTKEQLEELYISKNMSSNQIGKLLNFNSQTIINNLRLHNIKIKKLTDYDGFWKGKKILSLTERNLKDNPSKRIEVRKAKSELYKKNPKYQVNSKLRRDKITYIESKMIQLLQKINLVENRDYLFNKSILTDEGYKFPDFLFENKKIIIECDGRYWHKDQEKEYKRDKLLLSKGYEVIHFKDNQINDDLLPTLKEILL